MGASEGNGTLPLVTVLGRTDRTASDGSGHATILAADVADDSCLAANPAGKGRHLQQIKDLWRESATSSRFRIWSCDATSRGARRRCYRWLSHSREAAPHSCRKNSTSHRPVD